MKRRIIGSLLLCFFISLTQTIAQQETEITSEGVLIPRMDHTTIASPSLGQLVFDTNTNTFWFYDGSSWNEINTGLATELSDADSDTKVQVEESADEDMIRFDMGGTEYFVMDGPRLDIFNSGNSVFIGDQSGINDDLTDNSNTAVGRLTLQSNTTGSVNSAFGYTALQDNIDGIGNSALGFGALNNNIDGDNNVGVGRNALFANTGGNKNTAVGMLALLDNTTGSDNTALGYNANVSTGGLTNATAIGANATVSQSNALILGNNADVGIGTSSPDAKLHVAGGTVLFQNTGAASIYRIDRTDGVIMGALSGSAESSIRYDDTGKFTIEPESRATIEGSSFSGGSAFVMDATGQVGIGTSTPNADLHVAGVIRNDDIVMDGPHIEVFNSGRSLFLGEMAGMNDDLTNNYNVFVGYETGKETTSGSYNSAFGPFALQDNTTGSHNCAFGGEAMKFMTSGDFNSAFGTGTLTTNSGSYNTAIGRNALRSNQSGSQNTAIGYYADVGSGNLTNATAIGANTIVSQSDALILGNNANVGIGTSTPDAKLHIEGDIKIVDGNQSQGKTLVSDTDGLAAWDYISISADSDNDTKIQLEESSDEDKIRFDLGGTEHFVFDGPRIEVLNSGNSLFIGEGAGANDDLTTNENTFLGYNAGNLTSTGRENTAVGFTSLEDNTIGWFNVAVGHAALRDNTEGSRNSAFGAGALANNTTGEYNVAIGFSALVNPNTGDGIVSIGRTSLITQRAGSNLTAIGSYTDVASDSLVNSTVIGYNAEVDASNKVRIGNSSITSNGGQVAWTAFSDARIKNNVRENIPGLSFINRLRPVSYHFDIDKQNDIMGIEDNSDYPEKYDIENIAFSGFLAQEVDEAAQSIGYDFSGVDKSGTLLGLRYAEFVVPLVKAVQELTQENEMLKDQLGNIMARLDALERGGNE